VRGVLKPVLDRYGVGFSAIHGFNSATMMHGTCQDDDGRDLVVLYVGDYDPSGMCMSEEDLPKRFAEYGGDHVKLKRIALTGQQAVNLIPFDAADKRKDPRFKWFTSRYGTQCWELDAMDPNDLRECVEREIKALIDDEEWKRCETVNEAEHESIKNVIGAWCRHMRRHRRLFDIVNRGST
jgi:hypothetical protein